MTKTLKNKALTALMLALFGYMTLNISFDVKQQNSSQNSKATSSSLILSIGGW